MTVPYDVIQDVLKVLDHISRGEMPTSACDLVGLSYNTFCTYTKKYPQLAELRQEAEDRLYDQMAEALPRIFDHPIYGASEPGQAATISGNIKWLLSRRRKQQYGEHSVVEHHITADREVLDALQRAKARAQGGDFDNVLTEKTSEVLDLTIIDEVSNVPERVWTYKSVNEEPEDPYDISSIS